jgi:hypothetical protein
MLPRVDMGELLLEVMTWQPEFPAAFTAVSGGEARLADLHVTIAAALTAHALNVGYTPVVSGAPALTRARISHVDQNYLRAETYAAGNAPLIAAQADELTCPDLRCGFRLDQRSRASACSCRCCSRGCSQRDAPDLDGDQFISIGDSGSRPGQLLADRVR